MPTDIAVAATVTVRVARSEGDRARVFALRARSRPDPGDAEASDAYDRLPNTTLLLAESACDGEALGSLRILAGDRGPLMIDGLLPLPASLKHQSIAEGSRLVVREGCNARHVRLMLWKAFHRYCLASQVQTIVVAAGEAAALEYEWLGFRDVFADGTRFAPRGRDVATHRLLRLDVFEAHDAMVRSGHPLLEFFFVDRHPEIDLLGPAVASHPRAARAVPEQLRLAAALAEVAIV